MERYPLHKGRRVKWASTLTVDPSNRPPVNINSRQAPVGPATRPSPVPGQPPQSHAPGSLQHQARPHNTRLQVGYCRPSSVTVQHQVGPCNPKLAPVSYQPLDPQAPAKSSRPQQWPAPRDPGSRSTTADLHFWHHKPIPAAGHTLQTPAQDPATTRSAPKDPGTSLLTCWPGPPEDSSHRLTTDPINSLPRISEHTDC